MTKLLSITLEPNEDLLLTALAAAGAVDGPIAFGQLSATGLTARQIIATSTKLIAHGLLHERISGYVLTSLGVRWIQTAESCGVAVGIVPHPNCARLVFSFCMANGTQDFEDNVKEYIATVINAVTTAVAVQGHGANGRHEATIAPASKG